jgi:hypothetical protein
MKLKSIFQVLEVKQKPVRKHVERKKKGHFVRSRATWIEERRSRTAKYNFCKD